MLKYVVHFTSLTVALSFLANFSIFLRDLDDLNENYNYNIVDDDLNYDIPNLVHKYGYPFENHTVTTEDGYILELHRLPYGHLKTMDNSTKRKAILIQHGIFVSSVVWLMEGPTRALAYKLADAGYDVWLGNNRGNIYARQHETINVHTHPGAFYNYSFHEIGYYDLAASIEYILNVTGHSQIDYAGHSQGCIAFFVLMSRRPAYNEKIRVMIAMAPTVYTQHAWTPAFLFGRMFHPQIQWIMEKLNVHSILSCNMFGGKYATAIICADGAIFQPLCRWLFYVIGGYNPPQFNSTLLPLIFSHSPVGASSKQVIHYLQMSTPGKFCPFNYGPSKNLLEYGQIEPPEYNITNIQVPVAVYYSQNDFYSTEKDTDKLVGKLPNVIKIEKIKDERFTHFNYMFGKNVDRVLYSKIISLLLNL